MCCKECHDSLWKEIDQNTDISILVEKNKWPVILVNKLEKIIMDFANFAICGSCDQVTSEEIINSIEDDSLHKYVYFSNMLKKMYLKSIAISLFFNTLTKEDVLQHSKQLIKTNNHFYFYIRNLLLKTNNHEEKIYSTTWKGAKYYYYLLFEEVLVETSLPFEINLINDFPIA